MALRPLSNLPDQSFVIIDANVFIYALSGRSAECRHLFERCLREEVTGIALFETVNEVTHRFMIAEALSKGLRASLRRGEPRRFATSFSKSLPLRITGLIPSESWPSIFFSCQ